MTTRRDDTARPALLGLGTAHPPDPWDRDRALAFTLARGGDGALPRRQVEALHRRSGVATRHLAVGEAFHPPGRPPGTAARMDAYAALAPPLAAAAARPALARAGVAAEDVAHLVTVSCTGFSAPGLDLALRRELDLCADVGRTHVGFMGCHGLLNGLAVAGALARHAPVLLAAAELCSLHFAEDASREQAVAHALFADGAAALVLGPSEDARAWRLAGSASCVLADEPDAMTWRIGDRGFRMTLSSVVPALVGRGLRPWLDRWLEGHGLGVDEVASWAVHPGGPRVLDAATAVLELPDDACAVSREVLASHGNMSSPTVGFLLERLRARGAEPPCVALAFGPGLVAEAALFT